MINIDDIVIQLKYEWGKDLNGDYIKYRVVELSQDSHALGGGRGISCREISNNQFIHYIPENTWMKLEDYRNSKIEKII